MTLLLLYWSMGFENVVSIATVVREAKNKLRLGRISGDNNTLLSSFSSERQMDFCRVIEIDLVDVGCRQFYR